MEGWEIISPKDVIGSDLLAGKRRGLPAAALPFTQSLLSQVSNVTDPVTDPVTAVSAE